MHRITILLMGVVVCHHNSIILNGDLCGGKHSFPHCRRDDQLVLRLQVKPYTPHLQPCMQSHNCDSQIWLVCCWRSHSITFVNGIRVARSCEMTSPHTWPRRVVRLSICGWHRIDTRYISPQFSLTVLAAKDDWMLFTIVSVAVLLPGKGFCK